MQASLQRHVGTNCRIRTHEHTGHCYAPVLVVQCAAAVTSRCLCSTQTLSGKHSGHGSSIVARSQSNSSSQFDVDDGKAEQLGVELGPREDDILPDSLADAIQDVSKRLSPYC